MSDSTRDDYFPSAGLLYALVGVVLLALGAVALGNGDESDMFVVLGVVLLGSGCYWIIAGAVARGIQLSRQ